MRKSPDLVQCYRLTLGASLERDGGLPMPARWVVLYASPEQVPVLDNGIQVEGQLIEWRITNMLATAVRTAGQIMTATGGLETGTTSAGLNLIPQWHGAVHTEDKGIWLIRGLSYLLFKRQLWRAGAAGENDVPLGPPDYSDPGHGGAGPKPEKREPGGGAGSAAAAASTVAAV